MLAMCYGAGFGVEVFIHGVAATCYVDRFDLTLTTAGIAGGSFGLMALFAHALGGIASDRIARPFGLDGRTWLLFALLVDEGTGLLILLRHGFDRPGDRGDAGVWAVHPHVLRRDLSPVSVPRPQGVGGMAAGFLFKGIGNLPDTLFALGWVVLGCAVCAATVRFSIKHKQAEQALYDEASAQRHSQIPSASRQRPEPELTARQLRRRCRRGCGAGSQPSRSVS